jgi:glycerophosphoryl diester phosphodiesterase
MSRRIAKARWARALLSAVVALIMVAGCSSVDLQGHRGARGHIAENSLEGFERALAIGVSTIELDIGISADGVVVITHDARLNHEITRGTDGRWIGAPGPLVNTLTFAQLRSFDVGRIDPASVYAQRFPHQQGRDGVRIPRLADLFALTERLSARHVRFNIETKVDPTAPAATVGPEVFARSLIAEIRKAGMASRATVQSFDWRTLAIVQREAPDIATAYLTCELPDFDTIRRAVGDSPWTGAQTFRDHGSVPKMIRAAGGRLWSPYFRDLTAVQLTEARALGIRVIVWTVNDDPDIERMLEWGVDGVISDYPDRVRAAMSRRGLTLPPQIKTP